MNLLEYISYAILWGYVIFGGLYIFSKFIKLRSLERDSLIPLHRIEATNSSMSARIANDGSFTWTVLAGQALGADYRVRVLNVVTASIRDDSNANFRIS